MSTAVLERKIINISSKRQITLPQKFFSALNFGSEAECLLSDGTIIIRPIEEKPSGEFAEEILADLIEEGYSGKALLSEFKNRQEGIRKAVKNILAEAKEAAEGKAKSYSISDVFDED